MEPNEITTQNAPASEPASQQPATDQMAGWTDAERENWRKFHEQRTGQAPEPTNGQAEPAATEEHDEPGSPTEPYALEMPADVPPSRIAEWEPVLEGFSQTASAAGLPQTVAQDLMQTYIDADAAIGGYGSPVDIPGANAEPYTPDDAERVLRAYWREGYDAQMKKVRAAVVARPELRQWLEDSNVGNDPRACIALSMLDDLRLSKAAAQAELTKLMAPKSDYWSRDDWRRKPAVARVQLLTRIANAEARSAVTEPQARTKNAEAAKAAESQTAIRAELATLVPKLDRGTLAERQAAKKKFMELTARL